MCCVKQNFYNPSNLVTTNVSEHIKFCDSLFLIIISLQVVKKKNKSNVLVFTKVQGVKECSSNRKERKTSPPVIGLISSHKQAASGTLGVRDKERAIELHNPSPGRRQCQSLP